MRRRHVVFAAVGIAILYMATGLAVIQQDEVGVVRRFGRPLEEPWRPGLHVGLPWGLDRLDRLKTEQTRTLTVGSPGTADAPLAGATATGQDDRLTADLNLVEVQAILQYRVTDAVAFRFAARSIDAALTTAVESAITRNLASRGVDDVLTTGRAEIADAMARAIQQQADREGLGISVRAIRLGRMAPPAPVAPAFADAARARSDRRQRVNEAEEYRDRARSDAEGRAHEIADRSAATYDRDVQLARGEAERFTKLLDASRIDTASTRRRLYLDAIADLLPRLGRKVLVAPGQDLDLSLFPDRGQPASP